MEEPLEESLPELMLFDIALKKKKKKKSTKASEAPVVEIDSQHNDSQLRSGIELEEEEHTEFMRKRDEESEPTKLGGIDEERETVDVGYCMDATNDYTYLQLLNRLVSSPVSASIVLNHLDIRAFGLIGQTSTNTDKPSRIKIPAPQCMRMGIRVTWVNFQQTAEM